MIKNSRLENIITNRLNEPDPLIQIIMGPRQVGKTTSIQNLIDNKKIRNSYFLNADGVSNSTWIEEAWQKATEEKKILIIDEIQKIPSWSETIKKLWDNSLRHKKRIKCILMGSSSLKIQKGLSESLTGRFEIIEAHHWTYELSNKLHKMNLENYLQYGGYPGSYQFIKNTERWNQYLMSSIIETVITKDIISQANVKSPGLFRQLFYNLTSCAGKIISYNKLLGQLQDKGNIDLIKYYLDLYDSAFLVKALTKFSKNELRKKQSSPKIIFMCASLASFTRNNLHSSEDKGYLFESLVGAQLVNAKLNPYYWADGIYEVDFIIEYKNEIIAIEVKSGRNKKAISLEKFKKKYPKALTLFINPENYLNFEKDPTKFIEKILF